MGVALGWMKEYLSNTRFAASDEFASGLLFMSVWILLNKPMHFLLFFCGYATYLLFLPASLPVVIESLLHQNKKKRSFLIVHNSRLRCHNESFVICQQSLEGPANPEFRKGTCQTINRQRCPICMLHPFSIAAFLVQSQGKPRTDSRK